MTTPTTIQRDYTGAIERGSTEDAENGVLRGIIATEGEASDGHILDVSGMELPQRPPLLFGHDDWSGERNLGSWTALSKEAAGAPGTRLLRGTGQVELGGPDTPGKAWRQDMAYMVSQGHIGGLSVRWEGTKDPVRRINLPSDHWAHVSDEDMSFSDPRRFGMYFPKSRMVEASVVTIGADQEALIGRAQHTTGPLAEAWNRAAKDATRETGEWVEVKDGERTYWVPRWVHERLMRAANKRLHESIDLLTTEVRSSITVEDDGTEPAESVPALPVAPTRQDESAPSGPTVSADWEGVLARRLSEMSADFANDRKRLLAALTGD